MTFSRQPTVSDERRIKMLEETRQRGREILARRKPESERCFCMGNHTAEQAASMQLLCHPAGVAARTAARNELDYCIREDDDADSYGRGYGAGRDDGYFSAVMDVAAGMAVDLQTARDIADKGRLLLRGAGGDLTLVIAEALKEKQT